AAETSGSADRILQRMATAHVAAGMAFAILATAAYIHFGGMTFLPMRTTVICWAFAWPIVLVLTLLVGPDRRVQGLIFVGYFGGLVVLCAVAWLAGTRDAVVLGVTVPGFIQPMTLWLVEASPSLFLLLFLSRTIRTIGPLVLVFVFVFLIGSHVT